MGSVTVETMAGGTLAAEPKKLHPFFTAPRSLQHDPKVTNATAIATNSATSVDTSDKNSDMGSSETKAPKRKRRKTAEETDDEGEATKMQRRGRKKAAPQGASIMKHFARVNGEDQAGPSEQFAAARNDEPTNKSDEPSPPPEAVEVDPDTGDTATDDVASLKKDTQKTPPKKMSRLNRKTRTIRSPPKPKESEASTRQKRSEGTDEEGKTPTPKTRRDSSIMAKISYGTDDASRIRIGAKIETVLNSPVPDSPKRKKGTLLRGAKSAEDTELTTNEGATKKETHPFFTGKSKKTVAATTTEPAKSKPPPSPTRPRIFMSTPCSPKKMLTAGQSKPPIQFGKKSMGLKTPGARVPAWPWKDMIHIRGDDDISFTHGQPGPNVLLSARKSKGNTTCVAPEDMILNYFAAKLKIPEAIDAVENVDTNQFFPPPPELRLPQRHFESGIKLEKRIMRELRNIKHPALAQLRASLTTALSAFDIYDCESTSWVQKYTPTSAVEVIQHGKEAFLLRDWLQALKVQSVDTGDGKPKQAKSKPPRKKRRKNKLDDFIVDSDEEADEMDEISYPEEEDWSPDRRGLKKTVIRAGDILARDSKNATRLTNTVVISGPHGCGKTSAVYAIARELDFEVFEINSGSRRSGKDVLEKIGDMTRNHLVQHQQTDAPAAGAVIDEEEIAADIKSGKQATMNAFFKPKAATKPVQAKKAAKKEPPAKSEAKRAPPKNQKQSLILLDEVDILYEEDKQFWTTVIALIAQSKRPFIMTCNDENLVPLHTLNLHGIFRFSAPPTELAVDRLLMTAACEGHSLCRTAVEALYEARRQDLRACLMDLNFWCQIGVGDRRGGIDWFYPRWPKGCDIDGDGNVVRVISQDTYQEGMGWLAHDVLTEATDEQKGEEELLQEAWDCWQMDLGNWQESIDLPSWAASLGAKANSRDRLSSLERYDDFADAMSIAYLSSAMALATSEESIDCTHPDITAKARDDYIIGCQLLDAPVASTYDPLPTSLPISMKQLARNNLQSSTPGFQSSQLDALEEASVIYKIRQHVTQSSAFESITRDDFSLAFDPLAASEKASFGACNVEFSIFDGTMTTIAVDVAPYVRGIVAYDSELQKQRLRLSNLMSKGGSKRMRNTRAAHAALEGGSRGSTRADRWFNADLNGVLVMRTAGERWAEALKSETRPGGGEDPAPPCRAVKGRGRRIVVNDEETSAEESGSSPCGNLNGTDEDED